MECTRTIEFNKRAHEFIRVHMATATRARERNKSSPSLVINVEKRAFVRSSVGKRGAGQKQDGGVSRSAIAAAAGELTRDSCGASAVVLGVAGRFQFVSHVRQDIKVRRQLHREVINVDVVPLQDAAHRASRGRVARLFGAAVVHERGGDLLCEEDHLSVLKPVFAPVVKYTIRLQLLSLTNFASIYLF